jgi:DNA-directed RNA polymerase specialized sigma24 family protein
MPDRVETDSRYPRVRGRLSRRAGFIVAQKLHPDHFAALLARLATDRDLAGERYVELSRRLRTIFLYRHCPDVDVLVDETLDRAGRRLLELGDKYDGSDPARYVFGVAWNVARESFRRRVPEPLAEGKEVPDPGPADPEDAKELRSTCLDQCLKRLPEDDRNVALRYYRGEKRAKIEQRAALARDLGASPNALRLKVHRITRRLRQCVFHCMDLGGLADAVAARSGPHLAEG